MGSRSRSQLSAQRVAMVLIQAEMAIGRVGNAVRDMEIEWPILSQRLIEKAESAIGEPGRIVGAEFRVRVHTVPP